MLDTAKIAQRQAIERALTIDWIEGRKPTVDQWDTDCFARCGFRASDMIDAGLSMPDANHRRRWESVSTPRKYLNELVAFGFITATRYSGVVVYRFNRKTCDALAAVVRPHLLSRGLPEVSTGPLSGATTLANVTPPRDPRTKLREDV